MERIIISYVIAILYALFEMYMNRQQRKTVKVERKGDRNSLLVMTFSIAIGYFLCFSFAFARPGRINNEKDMLIAGMIVILIGFIIRAFSIIQLKKYFTYTVSEVKDHQLIDSGLYKYIRHPGYLGQLLVFTGVSLLLSNWISSVLMLVSVIPGYLYRIRVEELFMSRQMGTIYDEYRKRTKKLIPGIF